MPVIKLYIPWLATSTHFTNKEDLAKNFKVHFTLASSIAYILSFFFVLSLLSSFTIEMIVPQWNEKLVKESSFSGSAPP
jgi:hypothetical protein